MTITVDLFIFWISMIIVFGVVWFCKDLALLNVASRKQNENLDKFLSDTDEMTDFEDHVDTTPGMKDLS